MKPWLHIPNPPGSPHVPYTLYEGEPAEFHLFTVDDYGWMVPTSAKQVLISIGE